MTYEGTLETFKLCNSSGFRYQYLHYILDGLLQSRLYSKDEVRKHYYEAMAVYYNVDHSTQNITEAQIEANLIDKIESAFIEAINRRELSEIEKAEIKKEHIRYMRMWADTECDSTKWLDELKSNWDVTK